MELNTTQYLEKLDTPAVNTLAQDGKDLFNKAVNNVADSIDAALGSAGAAAPKIDSDAAAAVASIIEELVPPVVRSYVQLVLGVLPTGTALADLNAEQASLLAFAKARVDALRSL